MNKQATKGKGHRPQTTSNNKGDGKKKDDDSSSFVYNLGILIGCSAEIHTKSGERYEGIFSAFSQSSYEIMIEAAHLKESNVDDETTAINEHYDLLIVPSDKILYIKFPNAEISYACRDFQIDAAIGATRGTSAGDKELTPWVCPDDTGEHLDLDMSSTSNGWEARDMFKKNEEQYGVRSTFKQDLSGYTTQLDKNDPELRKHEEQAAQIAQAIENNSSSYERIKVENGDDEEAEFSAVVRPGRGNAPPPSSSSSTTSNQPPSGDKYVPPSRRQNLPSQQQQQQPNVPQMAPSQSHPANNSSSPPITNNSNNNNSNIGKPPFVGSNNTRYSNPYKSTNPNNHYQTRYDLNNRGGPPRSSYVNVNNQRGGPPQQREDTRPHLDDRTRVPNKSQMVNNRPERENPGRDPQINPHHPPGNQHQPNHHQQPTNQHPSSSHPRSTKHQQPHRSVEHFRDNFNLKLDRGHPQQQQQQQHPLPGSNNNNTSSGIRNQSPPNNINNNNNNNNNTSQPPTPSSTTTSSSSASSSLQSPTVKPKKEEPLPLVQQPPSSGSASIENGSSNSPSTNPSPPNASSSSASPSPNTSSGPSEVSAAAAKALGSKSESQSAVVASNNDSKGNADSDKSKKIPFAFNPNAKEFNPTAKAFTPQRSPSTPPTNPPRPPSTPASAPPTQLIQPVHSFMSLPIPHQTPLLYAPQYQAALTPSTNSSQNSVVNTPRHNSHRKPMMNVTSRSDINISQPMQMATGPPLLPASIQTAAPSQAIYFQAQGAAFPQVMRLVPGMMPAYQTQEQGGGGGQMHQPMHFLHNGTASQNNPGHQSNNTPQTNPNAPTSVVQANGHAYGQGAGYPYVTFNHVPANMVVSYPTHGPPPHHMQLTAVPYVSHQGGGNTGLPHSQ